jgi:hypothetical protein
MLQIQFRDELSYQIAIHLGALCKVDLKIVATKSFVRSFDCICDAKSKTTCKAAASVTPFKLTLSGSVKWDHG